MTMGFDEVRPPSRAQAADCVHCGFCLPACPTYRLWGREADSPRGRVHLITLALDGAVPIDRQFAARFDACLGCMACESACPSGVEYEPLLEATRAQIERRRLRGAADSLFRGALLAVFPRRPLLRAAALGGLVYRRSGLRRALRSSGAVDHLPARLRAAEALLPDVSLRGALAPTGGVVPARGARRLRVGLVPGCVQSVFFRDVHDATARVLAAEGCEVVVPRASGCCGALPAHAGEDEIARTLARRMLARFGGLGLDRVVVDAAGCGSTMKGYGRLLGDDPIERDRASAFAASVVDVHELLAEIGPRAPRAAITARVAYHDACHLAHAQGIRRAPRALLATIPGVELLEIPDGDLCCGSAGIYNLLQPQTAEELGRRKAQAIASVGADVLAAANPGCLLQIGRHLDEAGMELLHPIQLLDRAISAAAARSR